MADITTFQLIIGAMGSIIVGLVGILTTIAWNARADQKASQSVNSLEHGEIFKNLTEGAMIFEQLKHDSAKHDTDIGNLDNRVDEHDKELIRVNGKIKSIYTKID